MPLASNQPQCLSQSLSARKGTLAAQKTAKGFYLTSCSRTNTHGYSQKHKLSPTLRAKEQGNSKIIVSLECHFSDKAITSVPLSFCCRQNKLGNLTRTAVVDSILVLHKPKTQRLQTSHEQQQQLFFPFS